jgi:hypothetical protein
MATIGSQNTQECKNYLYAAVGIKTSAQNTIAWNMYNINL